MYDFSVGSKNKSKRTLPISIENKGFSEREKELASYSSSMQGVVQVNSFLDWYIII